MLINDTASEMRWRKYILLLKSGHFGQIRERARDTLGGFVYCTTAELETRTVFTWCARRWLEELHNYWKQPTTNRR